MNNQFYFCFKTSESLVGETYFLEGRKYLCRSIIKNNFATLSGEPIRQLLVPDDNSLLANNIRNNPTKDEYFSIPFSDLKFQSQLVKKDHFIQDAFLVKNTKQAKKISEKETHSPQILTFKVLSQKRKKSNIPDPRCYLHELEIEPLNLGMEGLPEIRRIVFDFCYSNSLKKAVGSLIKTWLHNHKILNESAGKTFTMKVNGLQIDKDRGSELVFNNSENFDVDSFQEKTAEDQPDNNSPSPIPKNNNSASPKKGNKGLVIFAILGCAIVVVIMIFLIAKKKTKN